MCTIIIEELFCLGRTKKAANDAAAKPVTEKLVNETYEDRKVSKQTKKQLHASLYEPLKEAVNEGIKSIPKQKLEYGTPNFDMLKNLQVNAATFAAFKSHALQKEVFNQLKDDKGNLRSREDFKKEALKIDDKYRKQYLDTEYDTGVRASRMAAIWEKAQKTKRIYPNLKYMPSAAATPREDHKKYYGIIRPIDDPFWNEHYPPNGWNCKCSVEPSDEDSTDLAEGLPAPQTGFDFNSGKQGQAFDLKDSQYIKSVPPKEQPKLIKEAEKLVNKDLIADADYVKMYNSKKGGSVAVHPLSIDAKDYKKDMATARLIANQGHQVKLLPKVSDPQLREALLPHKEIKGNSNPKAIINDDFVASVRRVEKSTKTVIKHALDDARQQANNSVIVIGKDNKLTKEDVLKQITQKAKRPEMKDFGEIWVNYKGEWLYNPHQKK